MKAQLLVVAEGDRVVDLAVDPPLGAKIVDSDDGPVLYLVNSAASLLEDDELFLEIIVAADSRLTVRSVAAQLAHPCLSGGSTGLTVRAEVGSGGSLAWWPEPLIVCAQSNHHSIVEIGLADDAALDWVDELVLGRSTEDPAAVGFASELSIARDGVALLEDGLCLSPAFMAAWRGPAVLGDARYVGSRLQLCRPSADEQCMRGWTRARMRKAVK